VLFAFSCLLAPRQCFSSGATGLLAILGLGNPLRLSHRDDAVQSIGRTSKSLHNILLLPLYNLKNRETCVKKLAQNQKRWYNEWHKMGKCGAKWGKIP